MARLTERLTAKRIERDLRAPTESGRQEFFWDSELPGFGVRCSGTTRVKAYVVQRDVRGRARRLTIGNVNELTLAEAREKAGVELQKLREGIDPRTRDVGPVTLAEVLEKYVEKRNLRPRTEASYRDAVERLLRKWLDLPLADITPTMFERRYEEITKNNGPYAANNVLRTLRALANFKRIPDPTSEVEKNPETRREGVIRSDDLPEFWRAASNLDNPALADYLRFVLVTGLRREAAAAIEWSHVDFSAEMIRLPSSRTKSGRKFNLAMTDVVRDILLRRAAEGRAQFVFASHRGEERRIKDPRKAMAAIAKETGITNSIGEALTIHDLRRTYVSVAEGEVSFVELKCLVDHALPDKDVTVGYVQVEPKKLAAAARRVADRLKVLCQMPKIVVPSNVAFISQAS
jgi:integrase